MNQNEKTGKMLMEIAEVLKKNIAPNNPNDAICAIVACFQSAALIACNGGLQLEEFLGGAKVAYDYEMKIREGLFKDKKVLN